jgi:hypothetical protein
MDKIIFWGNMILSTLRYYKGVCCCAECFRNINIILKERPVDAAAALERSIFVGP